MTDLPDKPAPSGRPLDRAALERVLARASELQAGTNEPTEAMTKEQLIELGKEVGLAPEYVASAHRYLGDVAADMVAGMDQPGTVKARIVVRPTWVGLLDFAERLPSPLGGV